MCPEEWVQVVGLAFGQEGKAAGGGEFVKESENHQHFPAGGRQQRHTLRGKKRHRDQGGSGTATQRYKSRRLGENQEDTLGLAAKNRTLMSVTVEAKPNRGGEGQIQAPHSSLPRPRPRASSQDRGCWK